jgi:hypothetical protein
MKSKLVYVELKTGFSDKGPAWIGMAHFSRTGESVYFNGLKLLKGGRRSEGNYLEWFTLQSYWVSGVKKNAADRHWAGGGKIQIDKSVVEEYLNIIKLTKLPSNQFEIVELDNNPRIQDFHALENQKIN